MSNKPSVVLVHGFWGGAAHWAKVIVELNGRGYGSLHAVENPLTSLYEDAERTQKMVKQVDGPVLLVGHSYGGRSSPRLVTCRTSSGSYTSPHSPRTRVRTLVRSANGMQPPPRPPGMSYPTLMGTSGSSRTSSARASARTCPPTKH